MLVICIKILLIDETFEATVENFLPDIGIEVVIRK